MASLTHRFPRSLSVFTLVASIALGLPSCTITVEPTPSPPPDVRIRLDGDSIRVPQGTTYGAYAETEDIGARDGRLLSVSGVVLERHISEGHVELNGATPDPWHLLDDGDRIDRVVGEDSVEGTRRVMEPVPGRSNAFVQRTLATFRVVEVTTVGRISGEVADVRFRTRGRPRVPRAVALTFDDGPWPGDTEAILRILARERARATFFMVGDLATQHPELVHRVLRAGHVVANHSMTHTTSPSFAELAPRRLDAEIARAADALRLAGAHPTLFRPPGGSYDDEVVLDAWRHGERVVLWSVDPHDWDADRTPRQIAKDVMRRVRPGSIVLLHDGGGDGAQTAAALGPIIRRIRSRGLKLVTLDPYRGR